MNMSNINHCNNTYTYKPHRRSSMLSSDILSNKRKYSVYPHNNLTPNYNDREKPENLENLEKMQYIMEDFKPYQIICQYNPIKQFIFQDENTFSIQLRNAMKILYELRVLIGFSNETKAESPIILKNEKIKEDIYNLSVENGHELLCAITATMVQLFNKRRMTESIRCKCMQTIITYSNQIMTADDWHNINMLYYNELLEWSRDDIMTIFYSKE